MAIQLTFKESYDGSETGQCWITPVSKASEFHWMYIPCMGSGQYIFISNNHFNILSISEIEFYYMEAPNDNKIVEISTISPTILKQTTINPTTLRKTTLETTTENVHFTTTVWESTTKDQSISETNSISYWPRKERKLKLKSYSLTTSFMLCAKKCFIQKTCRMFDYFLGDEICNIYENNGNIMEIYESFIIFEKNSIIFLKNETDILPIC